MTATLGVAVIGCGRIGSRRAAAACANPASRLVAVVDSDGARAAELAAGNGAVALSVWREALEHPGVDAVVACTPNGLLAEIAIAALERGKHVLLEKPMGRGVVEAERIAAAAAASQRTLRVGFNHRYHPALERAHALVTAGELGRVLSIRARYGHGGRPGSEREWRADPLQAGGGELLDQGIHLADLIHWFAGVPAQAFGMLQTAYWPIAPLEDNAFGLFRWADGSVAQIHVSMTQWKNLFSFEVCCEAGSVVVEGLGGSYGVERLIVSRRLPEGGAPVVVEEAFDGPDASWALEWADFVAAARANGERAAVPAGPAPAGARGMAHGAAEAGVVAMRMIDALYRSAAEHALVSV